MPQLAQNTTEVENELVRVWVLSRTLAYVSQSSKSGQAVWTVAMMRNLPNVCVKSCKDNQHGHDDWVVKIFASTFFSSKEVLIAKLLIQPAGCR